MTFRRLCCAAILPLVDQSYQERAPVPALAGLVSATWVQTSGAEPYRHRGIPNGSVELRCRIGSTPQIVGPLTRPATETLPAGTTVVGVRFHPGAAAAVLGLPTAELADLAVDVDDVWGRQRLDSTDLMQRFLLGRMTRPDPLIAEAVRRLRPGASSDVTTLRESLAISERQFRRRCQDTIGLAPKALHRMLRFQGFLAQTQFALAQGQPLAGLARLATDTGYADQAHLTRECLRLTGVTPRAFLSETAEQCGCGHDHAASYTPLLRMAGLFKNGLPAGA